MKSRIILFLSLSVCLIAVSCKLLNYRGYAGKFSISYGSSGGFSGGTDEYLLNGSGELREIKAFSKDSTLLKTISKSELKKAIKLADSKAIKKISLDESGNMNNFIKIFKEGKLMKSFQWPQGKTDIPSELEQLNSMLNKLKQK